MAVSSQVVRRRIIMCLLGSACAPTPSAPNAEDQVSLSAGTKVPDSPENDDDDDDDSTSVDTFSSDTVSFVDPSTDFPPDLADCSVHDQDCPQGSKCTIRWGEGLEYPYEVGTLCVPVVSDPKRADQACTRQADDGIDDCDRGARCVPTITGEYRCVPFCLDGNQWTCRDLDRACVGSAGDGDWGCEQRCDPLHPQCPYPDSVCVLAYPTGKDFVCEQSYFPASAGDLDPCEFDYECQPGLGCVPADALGEDCATEDKAGCCTPYCRADAPASDAGCTREGLVCKPLCAFGYVQLSSREELGRCVEPEAQGRGHCIPDHLDPNIPWCSPTVDQCPQGSFGGGNSEWDWCSCMIPCDSTSDCPSPESATATPTCLTEPSSLASNCVLDCQEGTCPIGMTCTDAYLGDTPYCVWQYPSDW